MWIPLTVLLATSPAAAKPTRPPPAAAVQQAIPAELSPARRKRIERLLTLTGSDALLPRMLEGFKVTLKPQEYERLAARLDGADLHERLVALHHARLTDADLESFVTFLESPTGTRWMAVMPGLGQLSSVAAAAWVREKSASDAPKR